MLSLKSITHFISTPSTKKPSEIVTNLVKALQLDHSGQPPPKKSLVLFLVGLDSLIQSSHDQHLLAHLLSSLFAHQTSHRLHIRVVLSFSSHSLAWQLAPLHQLFPGCCAPADLAATHSQGQLIQSLELNLMELLQVYFELETTTTTTSTTQTDGKYLFDPDLILVFFPIRPFVGFV